MPPDTPPSFDDRWLVEAVRLHEAAHGPLDDAAACVAARNGAATPEGRIVERARHLGEATGLRRACAAWAGRMRLAGGVLLALMLAGGVGAGLAVAGDGGRPINVVWALGGLLGLHALGLVLWLAGFFLAGATPAGIGAAWSGLAARFAGGAPEAPRALTGLLRQGGLLRWWLGSVTHATWSAALAGALVGLTASFLLRSHVFVWETTLLSPGFFVDFVAWSGWLPARLGFPVPDAATVAASGASALADEAARRAWAWWLVGCVALYGLVPRVLLWLVCALRLAAGRRALRLDLALPAYAALAARLAPASERIGVTDAAPGRIVASQVDAGHRFSGAPTLVGIELRGDRPWPPALAAGVRDLGVADSREQRLRVRAALEGEPACRLLVACDGRLSPDRGSLGLIAEWSRHAGRCAVWLLAASGERGERWREALAEAGVTAVIEDEGRALGWLMGEWT